MVRQHMVVPLALCLVAAGCITGFRDPLASVAQAHIDERLLGPWACVSTSDQSPGDLTFLKFDSSQYYLRMADKESQPQDLRAIATRLEDSSFLSTRVIGPKPDDEWSILEYRFSDTTHLTLKYVDPQAFEDILDEPDADR